MNDLVECHSGYKYAERPVAFRWKGNRLEVSTILADWQLPDGRRFRVLSTTDSIFELSYNEPRDEWMVKIL